MEKNRPEEFVRKALLEDLGDGDHSTLACIPADAEGKARLLIKEEGILAGVEAMKMVLQQTDPRLEARMSKEDGSPVYIGDRPLTIHGPVRSILSTERLILNMMQRMSGIATETRRYAELLEEWPTQILDTRKTTPGFRFFEKWAVRIGGGQNHRQGLFDMIMLKDNHIDFAGGIPQAIESTRKYLTDNNKDLKIVIEARSIKDVETILDTGGIDRILLDNFSPENTRKAVQLIDGRFETESSGGITLDNLRQYASCSVDFISVGALTHHVKSLDMSLKAI